MKKNILITMSGGTTTVINATLAGLIEKAKATGFVDKIYAGYPGILGLLDDNLIELSALTSSEVVKLRNTPGSSFIGTTRVSILTNKELLQIEKIFNKYNIGFFVNIGGNGTIKQTRALASYFEGKVKTASAPKTVDNDLGDSEFKKVLFTPGFPSCVNYWSKKIQLLNLDNSGASSHDKVIVSQTFGRETGFIAGCVRVSDPNRELPLIILLPEDHQKIEEVLNKIENTTSLCIGIVFKALFF